MAVKPDVILSGLFHTPLNVPDVVDICADINAIATGVAAAGDTVVAVDAGGACKRIPAPNTICAQLSVLTPAAAPAVPGTTPLVGADCLTYVLPTLCDQFKNLPAGGGLPGHFVPIYDPIADACSRTTVATLLCSQLSLMPVVGVAGAGTNFLTQNCQIATFPSFCELTSSVAVGAAAPGDFRLVIDSGGACKRVPDVAANICATLATLPVAGVAVEGTTLLLSDDCRFYQLPNTTHTIAWTQAGGLVSTVNGIPATLAIPAGTIAKNVGYDAAGNVVRQAPAVVNVCQTLQAFPISSGIASTFFYGEQAGSCVKIKINPANYICTTLGALPIAGPAIPSTTRFVSDTCELYDLSLCTQLNQVAAGAVAAGDQILAINGGVCKLIPFSPTTTNTLTWDEATGITSTVNGVAAIKVTPAGTIINYLGYDAAGAVVKQPVTTVVCAMISGLPNQGNLVPNVTQLVGKDCNAYTVPTVCSQLNGIAGGVTAAGDRTVVVDSVGACKLVPVASYVKCNGSALASTDPVLVAGVLAGTTTTPNQIMVANGVNCPFTLVAPACAGVTVFSSVSLGSPDPAAGGVPVWVKNRATQNQVVLAATGVFDVNVADTLFLDNAAAITVTLTTPAGCAPKRFAYKRRLGNAFPVTFTPASGQIDLAASYVFNGPLESGFVEFDGTNWWVL